MTTPSINFAFSSNQDLKLGKNKFELANVGLGACSPGIGCYRTVEAFDDSKCKKEEKFKLAITKELPATLKFQISFKNDELGPYRLEWLIIKKGNDMLFSSTDGTAVSLIKETPGAFILTAFRFVPELAQYIKFSAILGDDLSSISNQVIQIAQQDGLPALTLPALDDIELGVEALNGCFPKDDLMVTMLFQTDQLGLNLGEFLCIIWAEDEYPNGYPKNLIGKMDGLSLPAEVNGMVQTFYSAKPKLSKVLLGRGNTLFAQTNSINKKFDTGLSNGDFFVKVLEYSALKYFFAGLILGNAKFKTKWLYQKYNNEFLKCLALSEFKKYLPLFVDPQFGFVGFDKYFKFDNRNDCSFCN